MKPKEIQELLDFIASSGLAEVNIETENFKISVKKNTEYLTPRYIELPAQSPGTATSTAANNSAVSPSSLPSVSEKPDKVTEVKKDTTITIKSPMIGTFYRSSGPDTPVFVNIGAEIKSGQTVCIIEAMKLFNEIESEVSGKIVKILVENATPVEYDQPLFVVEPM